jgi:SAM-dependent methyltransferase
VLVPGPFGDPQKLRLLAAWRRLSQPDARAVRWPVWAGCLGSATIRIVGDMSSEAAITDLVGRVRSRAGAVDTHRYGNAPANGVGRLIDAEALRTALTLELRELDRDVRSDPSKWGAWRDGVDVVGSAYEQLIRGHDRRAAGQFQTPMWAAELMAAWLAQRRIACLLDAGVGTGRLLIAASKQRHVPQLMIGVDTDRISLAMARLNFALRGLDNVILRQGDFLLDDLEIHPDAVIANPPYSRHQAIPSERKRKIHEHLEEHLGVQVSRLAGLHVLFFLRAVEVLRDGGRLAFITPLPWLDVNYGLAVKRYVLARAHVDGLVIFDDRARVFPDVKTTATITLLTKGDRAAANDQPTRIVRLASANPPVSEVIAALTGRPSSVKAELVTLDINEHWSTRPAVKRRTRGKPLHELARVRRGVATGCKTFYVISEQLRIEHGLAKEDLRACIATPKVVPNLEMTMTMIEQLPITTRRWILDTRHPNAEQRDDALGVYLRLGRTKYGADRSYLAEHRHPWYGLEQRGSCPILFTYMNKDRPRFIRNRAGATALNNFLIIEPHDDVDADLLWRALNKPAMLVQLEQSRRPYGGGMWKLERHELDQLRVSL